MNRIKGFALGLGVATLIVVGLACGAAKTPAGSDELDTVDGQMEIAQALQAAEGSKVTVSGHLITDSDGKTRLCSVLAESLPPQCGGDWIHLLGFDASSVPNSKTPQRPSDIQTTRWTDSYITVTGINGRRGLAEARLSYEPATDSTDVPVPSPASQARETIACFPTGLVARVGASVGDSWTLAGSIRLQGKTPNDPRELRDGGQSSVTFTLTGLDDGGRNWLMDEASGKRARIENSEASVHITTVYRDDEGNALEATDQDEEWATFVFHGSGQALLTPDWDCHRNAWMTGGIPSSRDITRESSVGEIDLPTRSIVLFIETTAWDAPDADDEWATKWVYGYDKVTGRLVLTEWNQSGTLDGQPFTVDMVRELVPALNLSGISVAPPAPGPAVTGMIAPDLRLTFNGVEYTGVEILSAASPTGPVMCCGTPINMDDMDVVGTGTNHNPDGDASIEVYRTKAGATTDVYTFHPSRTVEASAEPGGTDTGPATWTRWTAHVAPPAPAAVPEATVPMDLGDVKLPEDADSIVSLFSRLPRKLAGRERTPRLDEVGPSRFTAASGQLPDDGCSSVRLQAEDLSSGEFFPADWTADRFVASWGLGADGNVQDHGRDGDLFWVRSSTICRSAPSPRAIQSAPVTTELSSVESDLGEGPAAAGCSRSWPEPLKTWPSWQQPS